MDAFDAGSLMESVQKQRVEALGTEARNDFKSRIAEFESGRSPFRACTPAQSGGRGMYGLLFGESLLRGRTNSRERASTVGGLRMYGGGSGAPKRYTL